MADRTATSQPGDYMVMEVSGGYAIRRALSHGSWTHVTMVDTEAQAIRLATGLATDHSSRALRQRGSSTFSFIEQA